MADQAKNVLIGLLVISSVAILIFAFFFIHPFVGETSKILRVRFTDIDKINVGSRVTFSGKPVGEVADIQMLQNIREQKKDKRGSVYAYELTLEVSPSVNVYKTDEVSIRTSGLLGEKSINIQPEPFVPGQPPILITDQILYAEPTPSVEDTMEELVNLSSKFDEVIGEVLNILQELREQKTWTNLSKTLANVSEITEALNQPEAWEGILDNLYEVSERLPESWDMFDESLENVLISTVNIRSITETAQDLIGKVQEGKGTMGQILVGNTLYLELKSILSKGNTIMDDINHYGLLFHLNKRWQRLNARRLNLLHHLSRSDDFHRYFQCELNEISSSLSRVSMVLREEERLPCPGLLLCNPDYTRCFVDLLQKVESIEESLQMYNQQVVDCVEEQEGCWP